ncbi:hypothetical protein B0A55_12722, partial [Friedmanniomyces simplex]
MRTRLPYSQLYDAPIFKVVQDGDIEGTKRLLSAEPVLAYAVDPFNLGLLYMQSVGLYSSAQMQISSDRHVAEVFQCFIWLLLDLKLQRLPPMHIATSWQQWGVVRELIEFGHYEKQKPIDEARYERSPDAENEAGIKGFQQTINNACGFQYSTILRQKIDQYSIQPQNCYNMDEKGFLIGHLQKVRRIFPKALMQQQRLLGTGQDGSR